MPPGENLRSRILSAPDAVKRFGKIPAHVILDAEITHGARSVFAVLALLAGGGNTCRVSKSELSEAFGTDRKRLRLFLEQLEKAGHIRWNRERSEITLAAPVFAQEDRQIESSGKQVIAKECARCAKPRPWLSRVGVCRACNRLAREAERYRALAESLGTEDHEVIARELGALATSRRWLRAREVARCTLKSAIGTIPGRKSERLPSGQGNAEIRAASIAG